MKAIQVSETGGAEVLRLTEVDPPNPKPGEIVAKVHAAGVNFIDTYQRTGLYPVAMPFRPGLEGAGTILAVGEGVLGMAEGDRVAWSSAPGSYAEQVAVPASSAVPVPEGVTLETAAAAMLQGMTAHYLMTDTFQLAKGDRCLIHAGAGGVGLLLIQMAKMVGAEVFTTVGTKQKAELAAGAGADHVILYRDSDFVAEIESIAGVRKIDVVFDGVGRTVFTASLRVLRPRGLMAAFGNASGPPDPISPLDLAPSLYLTRPSLLQYIDTRAELLRRSGEIFKWIGDGKLSVRIGERVRIDDAAEAHRMLEGRTTTGKVLLIP